MEQRKSPDDIAMAVIGGDVLDYVERHTPGGLKGAKAALDNYGKEDKGAHMSYNSIIGIAILAGLVAWSGIMLYVIFNSK